MSMSQMRPPMLTDERPSKRRKIRKGTTSCWECKRRKMKCHFPFPSSNVCAGCEQRQTLCLTQEYDDSTTASHDNSSSGSVEERLARVESLLQQLLDATVYKSPGREGCGNQRVNLVAESASGYDFLTPMPNLALSCSNRRVQASNVLVDLGGPSLNTSISGRSQTSHRAHDGICRKLHAALPSQRDADSIIAAGNTTVFLQLFTRPYTDLFQGNMRSASSLSALPSITSHPVIIARTLLYLANGLQNLHPSLLGKDHLSLCSSPATAMQHFLDAACTLITSDDEILESLEGLECLILEGVYHINAGNLKRARIVFRRAVGVAQLMGLHRGNNTEPTILDPTTKASPSFMWHRIVSQDRYLALMLGLPAATTEDSINESDDLVADECPESYLESIHSRIMGRITSRNEGKIDPPSSDSTRRIDTELEKAAQRMSPDWWLLQHDKCRSKDTDERFEDMVRILLHITHFSLLILLRLPYMFYGSAETLYYQSKSACVSASRELLNRYIRFRSMKQVAFCCRSIDFSAFIACLTLLIAHLQRRHRDSGLVDTLAHHHPSDHALVSETVESLVEFSKASGDGMPDNMAGIVKTLARIELEAASVASSRDNTTEDSHCDASNVLLQLQIPYLGIVSITKNAIFSSLASRVSVKETDQHMDDGIEQATQPVMLYPGNHADRNLRISSDSVVFVPTLSSSNMVGQVAGIQPQGWPQQPFISTQENHMPLWPWDEDQYGLHSHSQPQMFFSDTRDPINAYLEEQPHDWTSLTTDFPLLVGNIGEEAASFFPGF